MESLRRDIGLVLESERRRFQTVAEAATDSNTACQQPKRSVLTSSERGRAFRARWKQYETTLQRQVDELRRQVADLEARESIWHSIRLQRRHDTHGSLVKLVHKYYTMFQDSTNAMALEDRRGRLSSALLKIHRLQEEFLDRVMDPDVVAGDLVGPRAIMEQWHQYSKSHAQFSGKITRITVSGPEENPMVLLQATATGIITTTTFRMLFPGVLATQRHDLIDKFLHQRVSYDISIRYLFADDGRICAELVEIGFLHGLLRITGRIQDAAALMDASAISSYSTVRASRALAP
ncbi:hypothetical protein Poli38472_014413 [Pythium oligandrum]|uniref:Uncharacterized protein n=1 Tax=Pythium oligandrum TaxID=41045 RepID=A0A8K1FC04_PYTOL|nr:hypothetical protein Poli38472_014413 [Pythium oligandrum]|eukprot:TMW57810.1 hypothetical protein Poli38472_014413 [Pythium oligandrum]